ncbi:MAG: DUF169 domain-containing protein [Gammaproteobacteria bacterium]|nr:DUF169 domain-containing protein [Gammaproteobacteria bacterium]
MTIFQDLHDVLHGKVRGHPVGISLFVDDIPERYRARRVDPCAIVRLAMDDGEIVYIDREHHDCTVGVFTGGMHEGTADIRTGAYLSKNIPAYTDEAAARTKSGKFVLPPGTVRAIGAAPLNRIPDGVRVDWIVCVCIPHWVHFIGGARTVIDGTPPHGAAGTSFCSELFATPWHEDNVVITPADIGGRMMNRIKPEEMFVIVPMKYTHTLVSLLADQPDARAMLEATRPPDSPYWEKRKRAAEKQQRRKPETGSDDDDRSLVITMPWQEEAKALIRQAPAGMLDMAIGYVEDFARENGYEVVTAEVIAEQMRSVGMDPAMLSGGTNAS